jgi:uncharacterized protein (DUF1015 family)
MARVYPFQALRYNPLKVRLGDVVTQPYDKITPSMQEVYYQRSPYNLVRIILGLPELFDNETNNVYTRAAQNFREWREQEILVAEHGPAIYAYSQVYSVPGNPGAVAERRGFIALGEVVDYKESIVFRHEQTLAKPKSDRLNLLRATRAHFGQIFMLYSDPIQSVEKLLFAEGRAPEVEVTDDYGVLHRLWTVDDPSILNLVVSAMADKKLIIADGHHRYETALAYAREHRPAGSPARDPRGSYLSPAYPEAALMMTFINMDSDGLTILPTHRVVHSLPDFSLEQFLTRAREFFDVAELPDADAAKAAVGLANAPSATPSALVAASAGRFFLLTTRQEKLAAALPSLSERQRRLDVAQLHGIVLEKIIGLTPESIINQTNLNYLRDAADALDQVATGRAQIAFLLRPATLEQLREVAFAGETMPQKSTDFYPKLLSGLAIYALD